MRKFNFEHRYFIQNPTTNITNQIEEQESQSQPLISVDFDGLSNLLPSFIQQSVIALAIVIVLIWKKGIKPTLQNKVLSLLTKNLQMDKRINEILAQIGVLTGADRVILYRFSDKNLSDETPFDSVEILNKYIKPGVDFDYSLHLAYVFPRLLSKFSKEDIECVNISEIDNENFLFLFTRENVKEACFKSIDNKNQEIIVGSIALFFSESVDLNQEIDPEKITVLKILFREISQIFNVLTVEKKKETLVNILERLM